MRALVALALVAGGWSTGAHPLYDAACEHSLRVQQSGVVRSPALGELSGIVASRSRSDLFWVVNDSGDGPRVYAVTGAGTLRQTVTVAGARAVDWEDLAIGPGPEPGTQYLYAADIGDNDGVREQVYVYRFPEPRRGHRNAQATRIVLRYPDGARDAEALIVDPRRGTLVVITKAVGRAGVYQAPPGGGALRRVGSVSTLAPVTGASASASGDLVVLRTYLSLLLWRRPSDRPLTQAFAGRSCAAPAPPEAQGEAVAVATDGSRLITVGEGSRPPIYVIGPRS